MLVKRNKTRSKVVFAVVVIMSAGIAYFAFAADPIGERMMGKGMMGQGMMQGQGMMDSNNMMWQRGMGMHPMYGMMGSSSLAATPDGGAIIMMGNKLMKYDKDLNLVKEVEIKIDWASMQKTMMQGRKMIGE